jgi:ribulose-5-phosphate 4-epimerase/fuculose-1-phosphate aldolase
MVINYMHRSFPEVDFVRHSCSMYMAFCKCSEGKLNFCQTNQTQGV